MANAFKTALRNTMIDTRNALSKTYIETKSNQTNNLIKKFKPYRNAKRIALYHAANGEMHLHNLWQASPLQGKFCYFPCITLDKTLIFLPATPKTKFKNNQYGIPEPDVTPDKAITLEDLDVMFMPLVAFDRYGHRLGMGAGYYDRTLVGGKPGLLVGVAYEFQHQVLIYPDPWDIPLDVVITEKNIYWREPCLDIG